jgi:ABC-type ATPase with predicted acetyltransferase domain
MKDLNELIESRDSAFTDLTIRELGTLKLADLLTTRTALWYQSQQQESVPDLIIKIIDEKLAAGDQAFAHSIVSELGAASDQALRRKTMSELGQRAKRRRQLTETASNHAVNRLTLIFIDVFCTESWSIDWVKLVRFVDHQAA